MNVAISSEEIRMYESGSKRPSYSLKLILSTEQLAYFSIQTGGRVIGYISMEKGWANAADITISMFKGEHMHEGTEALYVILSYAFGVMKLEKVSVTGVNDNGSLEYFMNNTPINFTSRKLGENKIRYDTNFEKFKFGLKFLEQSVFNRWTYTRS